MQLDIPSLSTKQLLLVLTQLRKATGAVNLALISLQGMGDPGMTDRLCTMRDQLRADTSTIRNQLLKLDPFIKLD